MECRWYRQMMDIPAAITKTMSAMTSCFLVVFYIFAVYTCVFCVLSFALCHVFLLLCMSMLENGKFVVLCTHWQENYSECTSINFKVSG